MNILTHLLASRSNNPNDAFRERAIRVIILVALIFFAFFHILDTFTHQIDGFLNFWYLFIYGIIGAIYLALRFQHIDLAARLLLPAMLLLLIDPTAAYWSPGTVLLSIMFTFIFQLILTRFQERFLAMFINLGIYTYLVLSTKQPSPLDSGDYFTEPFTAILAVYMAHLIIVMVVRFIRQQQKLRDQELLLLEQQRVEVLRQFLGHSSHDLRTLLTRMSSSLYIAKRKLPESDHSALKNLEDASRDMEKLVLSMLEMAKLRDVSQIEMQDLSVDTVIHTTIDIYRHQANKKSQTIQFNSQTTFARICGDNEYLSRALGNILENAIYYSPPHSKIEIQTRNNRGFVMITFRDYGIGIAENDLPHIFDSFYRADKARNQSTGLNGLGLSITKKIIELHHGTISVQSEVDVGSVFTVTLPLK